MTLHVSGYSKTWTKSDQPRKEDARADVQLFGDTSGDTLPLCSFGRLPRHAKRYHGALLALWRI
jgi:hypothetical protein